MIDSPTGTLAYWGEKLVTFNDINNWAKEREDFFMENTAISFFRDCKVLWCMSYTRPTLVQKAMRKLAVKLWELSL